MSNQQLNYGENKQQITILLSLVFPDRDSNLRSTGTRTYDLPGLEPTIYRDSNLRSTGTRTYDLPGLEPTIYRIRVCCCRRHIILTSRNRTLPLKCFIQHNQLTGRNTAFMYSICPSTEVESIGISDPTVIIVINIYT